MSEQRPRLLEQQLRQAQKMEAMGTLASGAVHDFNNLLTAILACTSAMKRRGDPGTDTIADLDRIERAARRASRITSLLLGFARMDELRHELVDMGDVVDEVISILEHTLDKRIHVEARRHHTSPSVVVGDFGQLEQVIMNLALNAADAMPEGGELTIDTRVEVIEPGKRPGSNGVKPGHYVVADIADSGTGVPEEVRDRLFQPFVTTKPPGKGTGMGLAVAHRIVEDHGGTITVASEPEQGSTFAVFLPVATKAVAAGDSRAEQHQGSEINSQ